MPQIRPTKFTDFNDQPLNNAYVYVYKVGESYLDSAALLTLTDADTGAAISNPFRTNEYGYPINSNSQTVNPTFAEVQWAVRVESAQNVEVKTFPKMIADNFNEDTEQSSVVDATFADLPDAKNANLTAYDTVYIQNETAGWEGTLAGPTTGFYAHKDGTTGAPGTGTSAQFFDSAGNGFTRDDLQRVNAATVAKSYAVQDGTLAFSASKDATYSFNATISSSLLNLASTVLVFKIVGVTSHTGNAIGVSTYSSAANPANQGYTNTAGSAFSGDYYYSVGITANSTGGTATFRGVATGNIELKEGDSIEVLICDTGSLYTPITTDATINLVEGS